MKLLRNPKRIAIALLVLAAVVLSRVLFRVPLPHVQLPAETIPGLPILHLPWVGEFAVSNTVLAVLLADVTLLLIAFRVRRQLRLVPGTLQVVVEGIIGWWENQAVQMIGRRATNTYLPLILTVFLLILTANWYELLPGYDTVGVLFVPEEAAETTAVKHTTWKVRWLGEPGHGIGIAVEREEPSGSETHASPEESATKPVDNEHWSFIPFLRAAATDLNFTLALALICFFAIELLGFREHGIRYLKKFVNINFRKGILMGLVGILVGVLELISEFVRVISFSFRLFGNIFAGQMLLFVIPFLVPLIVLPVYGLELFVGVVQAFVFAILTLAFMSVAMIPPHGDDHS